MSDTPHTADPNATVPPFFSPLRTSLRRGVFFGLVILVDAAATFWLADLFWRVGLHRAHLLILLIFFLLNGLLALGTAHALFGAFDIFTGRRRSVRITKLAEGKTGPLRLRHAVVMPVYNEDSSRFCARIEAIYRSIEAAGHIRSFDFFLLSDTRNLDLWIEEETSWTNLCRKLGGFGRIYYRRRKTNENRKAGNIGDFVRTWGGNYESMLVLDADSLMDGADIVTMARVMEDYPRLGILQTPPKLIRGSSVFTRLQQFAMRVYGPLFIRGLNYWQLAGGSYWGHNALIRIRPFSDSCELPALPGREPFGGKILSHDFVEAALMVGEGWEVWLAWDIEGTYEEAPPTLIDHLVRDRRWCQGNMQHLWLIFARKLPLPSRIHLFMGIMAYLGSPLWFLFLLLGTWIAWDRQMSGLSALPYDGVIGRWLGINGMTQGFLLTLSVFVLLFLPKILAFLASAFHGPTRRSFGGFFALTCGCLLETLLSMLLAPSVMVSHTFIVLGIFFGRVVGWGNQNRDADGTAWSEAFSFHFLTTLLGIAWAGVAWYIGPIYFAWMSPILLGMICCIPISVWTSRTRYGRALARHGILSTPEELHPPAVLRLADAGRSSVDGVLSATVPDRSGVIAAIVDPYVNSVHVALLEPSEIEEHQSVLAEKCLDEGPDALSQAEMSELLYSGPAMLHMHRAVWLRPSHSIHPRWKQATESYRRPDLAGSA